MHVELSCENGKAADEHPGEIIQQRLIIEILFNYYKLHATAFDYKSFSLPMKNECFCPPSQCR